MSTFSVDHDTSWTSVSSGQSITNGSNHTSSTIAQDEKLGTQVSIEIAYGATANEGVKVSVLRDVDGSDFEGASDSPWTFEMPKGTSVTRRKAFWVPPTCSDFKIYLANGSGATVTADIRTKQAVGKFS